MKVRPFIKVGSIALLVLMMITLLCSLGFWQLERAKEKEALLAKINHGQQSSVLTQAALYASDPQALRFMCIKLRGHFINQKTILLDNKTNGGAPGYHVFVPFALNDDTLVLINRGWIPSPPSRRQIPLPNPVKGEVTIEGYLDFAYRNPFIIDAMETDSIQWPLRVQQLDEHELQNLIGKKIHKMLVVLDRDSPYVFEPVSRTNPMSPSRHRGYAFQWFSLAALLLVLCLGVLYFRGKK